MRDIQGEPLNLKGIPIKVYIEISTKISTTWILMARGAIIKGRQTRQGLLDFHVTRTTSYNFILRIHRQTHLMCERTLNIFWVDTQHLTCERTLNILCVSWHSTSFMNVWILLVSGHSTWWLATKVPNILCLILFCMSFQLPRIYVIAFILCVMNIQLNIYVFNCWVWQQVLCTNKVKVKGNSVLFHCQNFLMFRCILRIFWTYS